MGIFDPPRKKTTPAWQCEQPFETRGLQDIERRVSVLEDCAEWEAFVEGSLAETDLFGAFARAVEKEVVLRQIVAKKYPAFTYEQTLRTPEHEHIRWCRDRLEIIKTGIKERYQ